MGEVVTAVVTGFVSALTTFVAVAVFIGRQIGDLRSELKGDTDNSRLELKGEIGELRSELKGEIGDLRSELRSDIRRLDGKFDQVMFELLRHVRDGGHHPPPQAA